MKSIENVVMIMALVLSASACGITTGEPVPVVEIRTSANIYAVQDSVTVNIANRTDDDAWFFHCDNRISFTVEARRSNGWEDVVGVDGPQCQAIYESGVMRLAAGDAYTRTFAVDRTGTFRLRFLSSTSELNVGYDILYSNIFTLE